MAKTKDAFVRFTFEIVGDPEGVERSIRDQIATDENAYWQSDDEPAQMASLKIVFPEEFIEALEGTRDHVGKKLGNNYQRGYYSAYSDVIIRLKQIFGLQ